MTRTGNLVFIGDVHLDAGDPALPDFLAFLDRLAETSSRIVLLGDLFNLWIGRDELEQSHHAAVVAKLAEIRARGVVVRYLEGNRDYRVGQLHAGRSLDDSSEQGIVENFAGHRVFAVHGDLANLTDRQYRTWRRISRSWPVWFLFNLLPTRLGQRLASRLEAGMRGTNLDFKQEFPEAQVREYADSYFRSGHDLVVLGHFHVEEDLRAEPRGRILVLPEWKGSRRHLELDPGGGVRFTDS